MTTVPQETTAYWLDLDRRFRLQSRPTLPIVLSHGQGTTVWDVEGRAYLDFDSGQFCVSTGHGHPAYIRAIEEQARKLIQTGSEFTVPEQVLLAQKIADLTDGRLPKSYFACTGSEATEAALRFAKFVTGRSEVVALYKGFHGLTLGSFSVTGFGGAMREGYGPTVPGVTFMPDPYCYRCYWHETYPGCRLSCVASGRLVLDAVTSGRPAAIIVEPVMSAGGIVILPREYIQFLREVCDERGILLIFDEAMTGIGRTGKWFAYQHDGILPDVITLSKGLGGGIPVSSMTTTAALAERAEAAGFLQTSSHTGDPFLCGVGLANIEIIEREGLVENARAMGEVLLRGLRALGERHGIVGDVRGLGLVVGVEIITDRETKQADPARAAAVVAGCLRRGLIVNHRGGHYPGVGATTGQIIRMLPPLTVTRDEIDRALTIFDEAAATAEAAP